MIGTETLLNALCRLYDPTLGVVLAPVRSLMRRVAFRVTLREKADVVGPHLTSSVQHLVPQAILQLRSELVPRHFW